MPDHNLPYVTSYGAISKALEKLKVAATPDRFTQDFLSTKLGMKGGSPRPVIPFFKRVGFLGSDGAPTQLYKRFRNPSDSGRAAAEALKTGYTALYELNEAVHDLPDKDVKGLIVQATGLAPESGTAKVILGSFKALKSVASFAVATAPTEEEGINYEEPSIGHDTSTTSLKLGLSYTINLNLPSTSDGAVFNAIFRSLRENLLG